MEFSRFLIEVSKGEYFEIALDSNEGSTGYVWCVGELMGDILLIGQEEQENKGSRGYGASHKKVFQFVPTHRGRGKVVFKLVRPWLPNKVEARYEYIIHVKEGEE